MPHKDLVARTEYDRRYRDANPEKIRDLNRNWERSNPESRSEKNRRYREANPERIREANRRWYESNRERAAELNAAFRERHSGSRKGRWTDAEVTILLRADLMVVQRSALLDRSYGSCIEKLRQLRKQGYDI